MIFVLFIILLVLIYFNNSEKFRPVTYVSRGNRVYNKPVNNNPTNNNHNHNNNNNNPDYIRPDHYHNHNHYYNYYNGYTNSFWYDYYNNPYYVLPNYCCNTTNPYSDCIYTNVFPPCNNYLVGY